MSQPVEKPEHAAYTEAVKELQADGMYELQRLASKMPDQLLVNYPGMLKRATFLTKI